MSTNGSSANASDTKGKVTAETFGCLDTSQVSNEVWMVRLPPKLAAVWNEAPEGTTLGELVFTKGGKVKNGTATAGKDGTTSSSSVVKPSLVVHASEDILTQDQSDVPLEYTMEAMTKRVPVLHPFVRNPDGSVSLEGTVTRTANLQMQTSDERYRLHNKNRILKTNVTSSRYVKPVEANELSVRKSHSSALASTSSKGFGSAVQQFGKKMNEVNAAGGPIDSSRKRKYEDQPTRSVVFDLFSEQPYWSVKEMRQVMGGRPESEIRKVLKEIAKFNKTGENSGKWELKSEFKKQGES